MPMDLILTQDVPHLGDAGELVSVRPGYGRNYLLPKGLAVLATSRNKQQLEHERAAIERRVARQRADAESVAERINGMTLQFERATGEDERLFGSVTARDLSEQLGVAGVEIDHRKIHLSEAIKAIGKYEADVKLGAQVTATLKFWVVAKDPSKT